MKIFALFLSALIASAAGFDLKCTAKTGSVAYMSGLNYCDVTSLSITSPGTRITSVNGATTPTTFDGLYFSQQVVHYLPQGLGTFFPAIKEMRVYRSGLKEIHADDLENLQNLESLYIDHNNITELESDLFKFTPKMQSVGFGQNQITAVGEDLLTNLKSPTRFYFSTNKCINSYTTTDFETFKATLRKQCPYPEEQKKKFCSEDLKKYEKEISDLKAEIKKLKLNEKSILEESKAKEKEISDLKAEIEGLKHNNYCYNGLLDSCTNLLHEESQKFKKCKTETSEKLVRGSEITVNLLSTTDNEISLGMTVASPETKMTKIQDASGNEVKPNQTELIISQQNTLFLPTNLGQFFSSSQRLSVTFSGLYELDARSFLNMKHLTAVNFTGNKLVEISETAFSELTSLKDLDVSSNNIELISENAFKTNVNLEIVRFNDNKLETIHGQLFSNHKQLQKIFLHQNKLKYINAFLLTSLDSLEVVDLSGNSCIDLSRPNSTLSEITTAIADNCIAPVEVTCREEIVEGQIDESHCEAEELTLVQPGAKLVLDEIDNGKKIEKFLVISQKMLFIPIKLSEAFPNLIQLYIKQSQLTALQETDFEGLSLLQELTIERNNISRIDEGVFDAIPLITYLNLGHNKIEMLPPRAFAKLIKLKTLILKGNQLKKFTASMLPPRKNAIKDFQLQQNILEFIDSKILKSLRNAELIDLTDNECINLKYQKSDPKGKTLMDLMGIIEFECDDDAQEN